MRSEDVRSFQMVFFTFYQIKFVIAMAKYKSLFKVSGDIGDVNMFQRDGQKFVRETTSLDKKRIMTDPKFRRMRENMMEFGGAGKVSKSLRFGLAEVAKRFGDSQLSSRLTGKFRKMVRMANGIRGQRPVEPLNNAALLQGFPLHRGISLESVLTFRLDPQVNVARNGVSLTLTNFNPDAHLTVPAGASHYVVLLVVVGLTDHIYDGSIDGYWPVNELVSGKSMVVRSVEYSVNALAPTTIVLNADLPGLPTMTANDALVTLVGVEFYTEVSSVMYVLESGNAMNVVGIY
jgi:hypothetical protein